MRNTLDHIGTANMSLGTHYEQAVLTTLAGLWRRKRLILKTAAMVLALGIVAALALPVKYTAEAYVYGGLAAAYPPAKANRTDSGGSPSVNFDASQLVETRSRLLQSPELAYQVVERLGLERLEPEIGRQGPISSWLQALFYGDSVKAPGYQIDTAAKGLLRGLSVKTEPRVYLIVVRYTASDPQRATMIANSFVTEFLRFTTLQTVSDQRAAAYGELSEQLATFGEKHPKARAASLRVAAEDALFKAQLAKTPEELQRTAGENVTFARAVAVPSSPNPPRIIGIAMLLGLLGGIGLAYWLERRGVVSARRSTTTKPSLG
jgi:uncharacterized protein involved in exopolysaccharide biosynthesis